MTLNWTSKKKTITPATCRATHMGYALSLVAADTAQENATANK